MIDIIKIGDKDRSGEIVTSIFYTGMDHIIYETKDGVKWMATNDKLIKRFSQLSHESSLLDTFAVQNQHLREIVNRELSRSYQLCAKGNIKLAYEHVVTATARIKRLISIMGKLYYLSSCLVAIILSVILSAILATISSISQEAKILTYVATCGGLGSFLSVAINLNRIEIDPDSPRFLHAISGASRIAIGMIGAVFSYFLMKADILLGVITTSNSVYSAFGVAIVAGFSETLVPNMLKRVEPQGSLQEKTAG